MEGEGGKIYSFHNIYVKESVYLIVFYEQYGIFIEKIEATIYFYIL